MPILTINYPKYESRMKPLQICTVKKIFKVKIFKVKTVKNASPQED